MDLFKNLKVSKLVLILSWISIFVMFWLMIIGVLPKSSFSSWGFVGLFMLLAFGSALYYTK